MLRPLHVRAPFAGSLASLRLVDGDRVAAGDRLGTLVARASMAALAGARAMVYAARTETEQQDAQRALALATRQRVEYPLLAPESGIVVSHAANAGDLVNEGDDIVVIAPADGVAFVAQVVQSDLPRLRAGQPVTIELAARRDPLQGRVDRVLPAASEENLSAPVRIDFFPGSDGLEIGLFGTARILVGARRAVPVVPKAALVKDDVNGTTQVATVTADRRVRWLSVTTGAQDAGMIEIVTTALAPGSLVITSGQIGLPDGALVRPLE